MIFGWDHNKNKASVRAGHARGPMFSATSEGVRATDQGILCDGASLRFDGGEWHCLSGASSEADRKCSLPAVHESMGGRKCERGR